MINYPPEINNKNPFDMISPQISNRDYWLKTDKQKPSLFKNSLPDMVILTPEKARKTHNAKKIGLSIAGAVVLVAGGLFLLLSGGPKGLSKGFQKLRRYYERKLQRSKLNGLKSSGHYEYVLGKINKFAQKAEVINNYTTAKDFLVKEIMYGPKNGWSFTRKIHSGITNIFEKFGLKTVKNSYAKTSAKFKNLEQLNLSLIKELKENSDIKTPVSIKGVTKTKEEWLKIAKDKCGDISKLYSDNFSSTMRESRYIQIKKMTKELVNSFEKEGALWFLSKNTLNNFVAEAKILPQKTKMQKKIKAIRQMMSYSPKDLCSDIDNNIMKISSALGVNDKEALKNLNRVHEYFKNNAQNGKFDLNDDALKNLNELSINLLKALKGKSNTNIDLITRNLGELQSSYENFKQGEIQDILEIYKALLPQNKFSKIEKTYLKTMNSLDKSIQLETEDFVNKSRDLALGSAPTDIITILGGFATLAYFLAKADDNKERLSISLKYGIPVLAGIGISLYGNARLFAGTKSLILGVGSAKIFNIIGNQANKILDKYYKPTETAQNNKDNKDKNSIESKQK